MNFILPNRTEDYIFKVVFFHKILAPNEPLLANFEFGPKFAEIFPEINFLKIQFSTDKELLITL